MLNIPKDGKLTKKQKKFLVNCCWEENQHQVKEEEQAKKKVKN